MEASVHSGKGSSWSELYRDSDGSILMLFPLEAKTFILSGIESDAAPGLETGLGGCLELGLAGVEGVGSEFSGVQECMGHAHRAEYPLNKEYTLNGRGLNIRISGIHAQIKGYRGLGVG